MTQSRTELNCALIGDGSKDRVLEYPIRWLLRDLCPNVAVQFVWADLRRLPRQPGSLSEKIRIASDLYAPSLLFVHRDAEGQGRDVRVNEIESAACNAFESDGPLIVCVIPVRMTEAWLLTDISAIRIASNNPNGRIRLQIPRIQNVESIPDPKDVLKQLLTRATELPARCRRRFSNENAVHRLAQLISNYEPLRRLPAFQAFETDLKNKLVHGGWRNEID